MVRIVLIGKVVIVTSTEEERFRFPSREAALDAYIEVASELRKAHILDPNSAIIES